MGLSCSCPESDFDPGDWFYLKVSDYAPLKTKRGRRCCSCKEIIPVGALCSEIPRMKVPETEIEEKIYGEFEGDNGVPLAPKYLCERCADLLFSLTELGYCEQPWEDQRELVREYAEMHADFKPGTKT